MKRKTEEEGGRQSQCDHGKKWLRGKVIGRGCFTSVYLATLKKPTSRFCYFPPVMAVKSAAVHVSTYLQKEREVLINLLDCPGVLKCYGEEITNSRKDGMVYNVLLEFASGGTLSDKIKNSGGPGLSEGEVKRYTRSILKALIHIHARRYVHCDLKPDNIFLVPRPDTSCGSPGNELMAKVGDFGSAKRVPRMKHGRLNPYLRGTLLYMAPETVIDHVQGRSSDIWALGCIVLEMLTGQPPWPMNPDMNTETLRSLIGNKHELPKIPSGISDEAREFLNGCFVRRARFRKTAKMLFNHPFVTDLDDEFDKENLEKISDDVELSCSSSYDLDSDSGDDSSSCSWPDGSVEMEVAVAAASAEEREVQSENKEKSLSSACDRESGIRGTEASPTIRAGL